MRARWPECVSAGAYTMRGGECDAPRFSETATVVRAAAVRVDDAVRSSHMRVNSVSTPHNTSNHTLRRHHNVCAKGPQGWLVCAGLVVVFPSAKCREVSSRVFSLCLRRECTRPFEGASTVRAGEASSEGAARTGNRTNKHARKEQWGATARSTRGCAGGVLELRDSSSTKRTGIQSSRTTSERTSEAPRFAAPGL